MKNATINQKSKIKLANQNKLTFNKLVRTKKHTTSITQQRKQLQPTKTCINSTIKNSENLILITEEARFVADSDSTETCSSTLSSSHRSVDNGAEADTEDENDSEDTQKAKRKGPKPNENLVKVQNFLKCFGEKLLAVENAKSATTTFTTITTTTAKATPTSTSTSTPTLTTTASKPLIVDVFTNENSISSNINQPIFDTKTFLTITTTTTASTMTTAFKNFTTAVSTTKCKSIAASSSSSSGSISTDIRKYSHYGKKLSNCTKVTTTAEAPTTKPKKFTISTKFLRKPRNKLKTPLLLKSTAATVNGETKFNFVAITKMNSTTTKQIINEDSNTKFKDFSIDSLLNK